MCWPLRSRLARDRLDLAPLAKARERLLLELTHAFARNPDPLSDLTERFWLRAKEAVAHDDHRSLALAQAREPLRQRFVPECVLDPLFRQRPVAGKQVSEDGLLLLAERLVETHRGASRRLHLERLLEWEARPLCHLVERRLAAELCPQRPLRTVQLLQPLDDVHGHPDRARLVGEPSGDRLADPPGGVRGELVPASPVELLDRPNQAERSLLDQVEEWKALVAVILRDRDDQAQVRLDHRLLRPHVAALDPLRELDLLPRAQERVPACVAQEELEGVGRHLLCDRLRRRLAFVFDDVEFKPTELARGADLRGRALPDRT